MAGAASIIVAGLIFACTPTHVYDGDGPIWCAEGPRIRLSGIAAREIDGTCIRGHPCPRASGIAARNALVDILGGPRGSTRTGHIRVKAPAMKCRSEGHAKGVRTAATCTLPDGRDIGCAMLRTGTVLPWARYGGNELCRK